MLLNPVQMNSMSQEGYTWFNIGTVEEKTPSTLIPSSGLYDTLTFEVYTSTWEDCRLLMLTGGHVYDSEYLRNLPYRPFQSGSTILYTLTIGCTWIAINGQIPAGSRTDGASVTRWEVYSDDFQSRRSNYMRLQTLDDFCVPALVTHVSESKHRVVIGKSGGGFLFFGDETISIYK